MLLLALLPALALAGLAGLLALGSAATSAATAQPLTIASPADGSTIRAGEATITGTARPGAALTGPEGAPIVADAEGNWSHTTKLRDGRNDLAFRAGGTLRWAVLWRAPALVPLGTELRNADWSLVVENATHASSYTAQQVLAGEGVRTYTREATGQFVIVDLRVSRLTAERKSLVERDFSLYDDKGREYNPVPIDASFSTFLLRFGRLPIGNSHLSTIEPLETGLLFQAPLDATGLVLRVKPLNADVALT